MTREPEGVESELLLALLDKLAAKARLNSNIGRRAAATQVLQELRAELNAVVGESFPHDDRRYRLSVMVTGVERLLK